MTIIHPPIFLLSTESRCWRCGQHQTVVAIAGSTSNENVEPIKVQYVSAMPDDLLQPVIARQPNYRLHRSRTAKREYYTNLCECGGNYGDWFLHSEPGVGGFFPTMREEAELITVEELPLAGPVEVGCDSQGVLSPLILEHGVRKDTSDATCG